MIGRYFIKHKRKNKMKLSTRIALFIHEHIKPLNSRTLAKFDIFTDL